VASKPTTRGNSFAFPFRSPWLAWRNPGGPFLLEKSSMASDNRSLKSVRETAEYLGVSFHTLNKWRARGFGPPFVRLGKRVAYPDGDLALWIESNKQRSLTPSAG
jgi:predicted DNA-binding transcriptional regulator AlpA